MSLYVLTQEQVADMVKDSVLNAPPDKVMQVLKALSDNWTNGEGDGLSYLKCGNTKLYPMNYKPDEKVYHLGRTDGLE